jgi:hypothetical protein
MTRLRSAVLPESFQLIIMNSGFGWKKQQIQANDQAQIDDFAEKLPTEQYEFRIWLEAAAEPRGSADMQIHACAHLPKGTCENAPQIVCVLCPKQYNRQKTGAAARRCILV